MIEKRIIKVIFVVYIIVLFMSLIRFESIGSVKSNDINIIPFSDYSDYPNVRDIFYNIIGNIIIFIPFGMYLNKLSSKTNTLLKFSVILVSSLIIEASQFFLKSGHADIDDLIFNSVGGLLGILITGFLDSYISEKSFSRL